VNLLRAVLVLVLGLGIAYVIFVYNGRTIQFQKQQTRYVINDIYSLVVIPTPDGQCQSAVGYREKYVIGTFVAEPIKEMVCGEYYFQDKPGSRFENAPIVLVQLENGEHHWILQSQLVLELGH